MGWASFREDIEERFESIDRQCAALEGDATHRPHQVAWLDHVRNLANAIRSIRTSLFQVVDIATEPQLDCIAEVRVLRNEIDSLRKTADEAENLKARLLRETTSRIKAEQESKIWQDRYSRSKAQQAKHKRGRTAR